jgi:nucleoside-diphosphate-sugar epimerase
MPVVFVTGGSGFVGRHLIPALRAEGYTVRALARSAQAVETVRALEAEPVPGDVGDVAALERGMAGCEAVFHLAAVMDHSQGREALERVNVGGTEADENTVVDARARRELGYTAAISREQGLAEMRARS